METGVCSILPLPIETRLQLKSSVALNTLNDVAIGLVKNSLDAQAQTVKIEIDLARGNCCVHDDGLGIHAAEFGVQGGLGLMHHTSKSGPSSDSHGRSGRFLASLSALSLLSVSSHRISEHSENNITWHHSQTISRRCNIPDDQRKIESKHGTTVMTYNLFGNLPVRTKQRISRFAVLHNAERELDRLRLQLVALALAWLRPVRIIVSDLSGRQQRRFAIGNKVQSTVPPQEAEVIGQPRGSAFQLEQICTILSHAGFIAPPCAESWRSMSARTSEMFVRAAVCLLPVSTRQIQFISMGIHPLQASSALSNVLYSEVNTLFDDSAFGTEEEDVDISEEERPQRLKGRHCKTRGLTERQLKNRGKGLRRWPMFYIRIDPRDREPLEGILSSDQDDREAAMFFERVVQLIRSMILHFLQKHHLRPRMGRYRHDTQSPVKNVSHDLDSASGANDQHLTASAAETVHMYKSSDANALGNPCKHASGDGFQDFPHNLPPPAAFGSWSRIKSGKPRALGDLLSGLPQSKHAKEHQHNSQPPLDAPERRPSVATSHQRSMEEQLEDDVGLLLQALDGNSEKGERNINRISPQPKSTMNQLDGLRSLSDTTIEDGSMTWKNPVSGKTIRINSRTGLSLPDEQSRPGSMPGLPASELSRRATAKIQASSRSDDTIARRSTAYAKIRSERGTWLGDVLEGWQNSCFRLKERPIPSANGVNTPAANIGPGNSCHGLRGGLTESEIFGCRGRLSKAALEHATVLGQVDKKFILAILAASGGDDTQEASDGEDGDRVLVLFDQHAADERCRIEELYAEITQDSSARLPKPIRFEVTRQEMELFHRERSRFETWGVLYEVGDHNDPAKEPQVGRPLSAVGPRTGRPVDPNTTQRPATSGCKRPRISAPQVTVYSLPMPIAERCRSDSQLLIKMLRSEVWAWADSTPPPISAPTSLSPSVEAGDDDNDNDDHLNTDADGRPSTTKSRKHTWLKRITSCPRGVIELLKSRACRTAIMFNDDLTRAECEDLIKRRLARCTFPFQCAHGRPSLTVLGVLGLDVVLGGHDGGPECMSGTDAVTTAGVVNREESKGRGEGKCHDTGRTRDCDGGSGGGDFLHAFASWQRSVRKSTR